MEAQSVYLKEIYKLVNKEWFQGELPNVTVTVMERTGTYGHFSLDELWIAGEEHQHELNIAAGGLNRPIVNVAATIIHEATHLYCFTKGIMDTSNRGMYHNKRFKEEAEKRGLSISKHPTYGWTLTEPRDELMEWCKKQGLQDIDIYRTDLIYLTGNGMGGGNDSGKKGTDNGKLTPKKSSTRKYQCEKCGISVRATKEVFILCGVCMKIMEEVNW